MASGRPREGGGGAGGEKVKEVKPGRRPTLKFIQLPSQRAELDNKLGKAGGNAPSCGSKDGIRVNFALI